MSMGSNDEVPLLCYLSDPYCMQYNMTDIATAVVEDVAAFLLIKLFLPLLFLPDLCGQSSLERKGGIGVAVVVGTGDHFSSG